MLLCGMWRLSCVRKHRTFQVQLVARSRLPTNSCLTINMPLTSNPVIVKAMKWQRLDCGGKHAVWLQSAGVHGQKHDKWKPNAIYCLSHLPEYVPLITEMRLLSIFSPQAEHVYGHHNVNIMSYYKTGSRFNDK